VNKVKSSNVRQHASLPVLIIILVSFQPALLSIPSGFADDPTVKLGGKPITLAYPFKLSVNQTAYLATADLVFRFVNVTEDSRCPSDVQCIWAGQVSILVEYSRASTGERLGNLTLTLMGGASSDVLVGTEGYLVKLVRVDPYPVSTMQIRPSDYAATLIILRADANASESIIASSPVALDNDSGETLETLEVGKEFKLSVAVHNGFDDDRQFIAIMEARSLDDGMTQFLEIQDGTLSGRGWVDASWSWTPEQAGQYQLRTFVIDSLVEPIILTPVATSAIVVEASTSGETIVTLSEGQREGPLLVQKIYADRVEGLNFPEYPIAMDSGLPITLRIGEKASNGCTIVLTLTGIQDDSATFLKTVDENRPCPICWYQLGLMPGLR
jgi:hypothetical protein